MSTIKSFSVGEGDMYYINHNSDNFTVIDCCLNYDEKSKEAKPRILDEVEELSKKKGIHRFISTHPDEDHISGLVEFNNRCKILNFYCVNNEAKKNGSESDDFKLYKKFRGGNEHFTLEKDCKRRWMNQSDEERDSSGLFCHWPIPSNPTYKDALENAKEGGSPNNISPAITYKLGNMSFLWMGDMETKMQQEFASKVSMPEVDVVFAPHHGRDSGHIPADLMGMLKPQLIVIGEAPSEDLDYYQGYTTITQNSAGHILFDVQEGVIHVYVSNSGYEKEIGTKMQSHPAHDDFKYLGSIKKR